MQMSALSCLCALFIFALINGIRAFDCNEATFASILPGNASLDYAYPVKKGGSFGIYTSYSDYQQNATNLPALCAVGITVNSSSSSSYGFALFLPPTWDGRFFATGNPGFGGGVNWPAMGKLMQYSSGGMVVMSTDTGHQSAATNATWALNHPESIIDWAHRALHGSTEKGKQIAASVYGKNTTFSYYSGCSNGGRMGWKAVQTYPSDYNGVIVGAPPLWMSHLHPWVTQLGIWNLPASSASHIPVSLFQYAAKDMIDQCDSQDGVTDGIVQEPYQCHYNSSKLLCANGSSTDCLTAHQLSTLALSFSDWTSADDNATLLYPQFALGTDASSHVPGSSKPSDFGLGYLDNFVYNDSNWNWKTFSNPSTVTHATSLDVGHANAVGHDLTAFRNAGGKVISYHGLADPSIPPGQSPLYHAGVKYAMPAVADIGDFYKLYMVPGMKHCGGSDIAPYYIAGAGQTVYKKDGTTDWGVPGFRDAQHDVVLAIMSWVENGTAPGALIATKWTNNTAADGVSMQRPLCAYPQVAKYSGSGDVDDAGSWECDGGSGLAFPSFVGNKGTVPKAWV